MRSHAAWTKIVAAPGRIAPANMSNRNRLELTFAGLPAAAAPHLSVDGMTPAGPNLSHWPGNRTPKHWRADLSTGICLNFARAARVEQDEFLAGVTHVLNDHYDTDGFLSLLAVLRPEVALAREELCLLAAATGDFGSLQTERGFAVDRIVAHLADTERSPLARDFAGLEPAQRSLARYRWLLESAERVLDDPESLAPLWRDELREQLAELDACRRGAAEVESRPEIGLAIVTSRRPLRRMTLNTIAGAYRVLHVELGRDGTRFRYHDRTESWFELATFHPLPRRDLRALAAELGALGDEPSVGRWCADDPGEPIPELWFGADQPQAYGEVTRELAPSRLTPREVRTRLLRFFAAPADSV